MRGEEKGDVADVEAVAVGENPNVVVVVVVVVGDVVVKTLGELIVGVVSESLTVKDKGDRDVIGDKEGSARLALSSISTEGDDDSGSSSG